MAAMKQITGQEFSEVVESFDIADACDLGDVVLLSGTHGASKKILISTASGRYAEISLG